MKGWEVIVNMEFEDTEEYKKIFKFSSSTGYRLLTRESGTIEFKESFNWNSKDKYAKSIVSFANKHSGFLIFGVKNKPRELSGLHSKNFEDIDEATISQYLNSVFSPEVEFEKFAFQIRGKTVGIIRVHPVKQRPIVATKNDGDIKEGEIYYRYNAKNEKIKFPELRSLLDQIREGERKQWMELFEKISRIGPGNTALMDMVSGKIEGKSGTLVIDRKLIQKLKFIQEGKFQEKGAPTLKLIGDVRPISIIGSRRSLTGGRLRITDNPQAPEVRVKEDDLLKEFSLDSRTLVAELRKRYSNFKSNDAYHKIRRSVMDKGFCVTRTLNPRNAKSPKQAFYSPRIYKEFDKYYKKQKNDSMGEKENLCSIE